MQEKLSPRQAECLRSAARCVERAEATTDPIGKREYLELAKGWLFLARNHGFNDQINDALALSTLRRIVTNSPFASENVDESR
ncbi:MAG: hypothetical protein J2P54_16695 [Bradyrhizobiaceae bacterium]|nr:hypothetical protein [Bradyrhizobiaceae bacterium]